MQSSRNFIYPQNYQFKNTTVVKILTFPRAVLSPKVYMLHALFKTSCMHATILTMMSHLKVIFHASVYPNDILRFTIKVFKMFLSCISLGNSRKILIHLKQRFKSITRSIKRYQEITPNLLQCSKSFPPF